MYHAITYSTAMTAAQHKSAFQPIKPHHARARGYMRSGGKLPRYDNIMLYGYFNAYLTEAQCRIGEYGSIVQGENEEEI